MLFYTLVRELRCIIIPTQSVPLLGLPPSKNKKNRRMMKS